MRKVITYDVNTQTPKGRRRLRRVAQACKDYGQRVQLSVFEVDVTGTEWAVLRGRLLDEMDIKEDSVRFYDLGEEGERRTEHHGQGASLDLSGPLIA